MTAIVQAMCSMLLILLMGAGLSLANADTDGPVRLDRFFEDVNTFKASFIQVVLDEAMLLEAKVTPCMIRRLHLLRNLDELQSRRFRDISESDITARRE